MRKDGKNTDFDGAEYWFFNNKIHRDRDLPAVIHINGHKSWYRHGVRYRWEWSLNNGSGCVMFGEDVRQYKDQAEYQRLVKMKAFW